MKYLKLVFLICSLAVTLLSSTITYAHSDEYLDTQVTPNGGQLRMAGAYHFELVLDKKSFVMKEYPVVVFVSDHGGNKINTTGATGTATILTGKVKSVINLTPDGDNRLKGIGKYSLSNDLKVVLAIKMAGKEIEQARFTPFAVAKKAEHNHK